MESQIWSLWDKRSFKEYTFSKPELQEMLRVFFKDRKKNSERERNTGIKKVAMKKYLSVITLNVNGLNDTIKTHRIAECLKIRTTHMLPTRDPSQNKGLTQIESEWLEINIPSKWTGKKSWGSSYQTK